MRRVLTALPLAALVAGLSAGSPAAPAAKTQFKTDIAPILTQSCAVCHLTGQEAGNMALIPAKAVQSLVKVRSKEAPRLFRVKPGKPDESYLIMKLEGTHVAGGGTGAQMPFGAAPLSKAQIARIRKWIAEGARP